MSDLHTKSGPDHTTPKHSSGAPLWGVAAEFDTAEAMLAALERLARHDYGRLDAFSPAPVPGAAEILGIADRPVYPFAGAGFAIGAIAMFAMCTYATIWSYRFDIGGRPLFSWPAFIVPSASFGLLLGAVCIYAAMLVTSRLPRLNHPAFNIPGFSRATADRFFVAIESRDESFDPAPIEGTLLALPNRPRAMHRVPR